MNNEKVMKKEIRVYVIDTQNHINDLAYTNEDFIEQAEEGGGVYTLLGFQLMFNNGDISNQSVIRFISSPIYE